MSVEGELGVHRVTVGISVKGESSWSFFLQLVLPVKEAKT